MAFAPYTNTDVRAQHLAGQNPTQLPLLVGSFKHSETDVFFEFSERRWADPDFAPDMTHVIYLTDGAARLAKVRKTVAYVVVDEDAEGKPVIETWPIKSRRGYQIGWVFAREAA